MVIGCGWLWVAIETGNGHRQLQECTRPQVLETLESYTIHIYLIGYDNTNELSLQGSDLTEICNFQYTYPSPSIFTSHITEAFIALPHQFHYFLMMSSSAIPYTVIKSTGRYIHVLSHNFTVLRENFSMVTTLKQAQVSKSCLYLQSNVSEGLSFAKRCLSCC